ncbi:unnamed protein product [Arctogadus glacialis]
MAESPAERESLESRRKNEEKVEEIVDVIVDLDLASAAIEGLGKLKPKIQGAIEVSIGILMALAAIAYVAVGIPIDVTLKLYWQILIYIPAGGLTIAADRNPTRAKLCIALVMNVLVALSAIAGSVLHYFIALELMSSGGPANSPHEELLMYTEWFMLAASILLFLVSIVVVSATASALCTSTKVKAAGACCWQVMMNAADG